MRSNLSQKIQTYYKKRSTDNLSNVDKSDIVDNTEHLGITEVFDDTFDFFRYRYRKLVLLHISPSCPSSTSALKNINQLMTEFPHAKWLRAQLAITPNITLQAGGVSKPGSVSIWKEGQCKITLPFTDYKNLSKILQQYA